MKRWLVLSMMMTFLAWPGMAQYIPSTPFDQPVKDNSGEYWHWGNTFQHLDLALSLGTSGIGIELASPICESAQVRIGYEFMPHFRRHKSFDVMVGNEPSRQYDETGCRKETDYDKVREMMYEEIGLDMLDHVDFTGRFTMQNFKFLVDIFPLYDNKKLHFTVGFYWGPSEFATMESDRGFNGTISCITYYNKKHAAASEGELIKSFGTAGINVGTFANNILDADGRMIHKAGEPYKMTGGDQGTISIPVTSNSFKPYLGVGYTSQLLKKRKDIKFAVTGGVMFWGGTPSMYTPDGINITKDINHKDWSSVNLISKLKVYPTIGIRIIKNIL